MASHEESLQKRVVETIFFYLAKCYIMIHRPLVIIVAGSVGKTSTKMMLAQFLRAEKNVSYMDDSYNDGVGLYLSVFELKVPTDTTPLAWGKLIFRAFGRLLTRHPALLLLEYGISGIDDMDNLLRLAVPDVGVLTAVTPEHMEYLKTIDIVAEQETKILRQAKQWGAVNSTDVAERYRDDIQTKVYTYGTSAKDDQASYKIVEYTSTGVVVDFFIDGVDIGRIKTKIVAEPLVRQMAGAMLVAKKLGVNDTTLKTVGPEIEPTPGRMNLLSGVRESIILDDTANFSPVAGVVALQTLKKLPAQRRIAILGNMHELGDFAEEGFEEVGTEFGGIERFVLVGDLSKKYFGDILRKQGVAEDAISTFDTSVAAGAYVRDHMIQAGDAVLVKGPFGGFYLEEATKKLLADPADSVRLTRQSDFWIQKKRKQFGDQLDS